MFIKVVHRNILTILLNNNFIFIPSFFWSMELPNWLHIGNWESPLLEGDFNPAYLLIDVQAVFLKKSHPKRRDTLIRSNEAMLRYAAQQRIPVVLIEYTPRVDGNTIQRLRSLWKVAPKKHLIIKEHDNSFTGTDLDNILCSESITHTILGGLNTPCCVKETAHDAKKRGYRLITAADLMSEQSWYQEKRLESLCWYQRAGTHFETHELLLDYVHRRLNRDAA